MITIYERKDVRLGEDGNPITAMELRGLSTDEKPTENIDNGSSFIEIDTGKIYMFDLENEEWKEI